MRNDSAMALHEQQVIPRLLGEQRLLLRLSRECESLQSELEMGETTEWRLRRVEGRLTDVCQAVTLFIRKYARLRGGWTKEEDEVRFILATSHDDLAWLRAHRHPETLELTVYRLQHALRALSNAVALLRWSCV